MNNSRHYLLPLILIFHTSVSSIAQNESSNWELGVIAPYFSSFGGSIGYSFDLKQSEKQDVTTSYRIGLLSQVSYFAQQGVAKNVLLNPELFYKWSVIDKKMFLLSSVGMAYLLSLNRREGSLSLASGKIEYTYEGLHFWLPTINLGFGFDPKRYVGFMFKASYGYKVGLRNANESFFAISSGIILKLVHE